MKKRLVYTLAAAVAAGATPVVSVVPVSANTSVQTNTKQEIKKITTAQDFVDVYCSLQKIDAKGKLLDERVLITEVNEKNYEVILSGKTVYDSLSKDMKLKIDDLLNKEFISYATVNKTKQLYTCYADMVFAAQTIDKQLNPQNYQEVVTPETNTETVDKENSSSKEEMSDNKESSKDTETTEKNESNLNDEQSEESKDDIDNNSDKKEDASDQDENKKNDSADESNKKDETANPDENKDDDSEQKSDQKDDSSNESIDQENDGDDSSDSQKEQAVYPEIVIPVDQTIAENSQPKQTKVGTVQMTDQAETKAIDEVKTDNTELLKSAVVPKQETEDMTAQSFVNTYLTSSAGNVYAKANSLNYRNILNGLSSWNQLTSAQRSAVNSILNKNVGKTYQTLLKEAQQLQYNGITSTVTGNATRRVNTATETQTGLYGALMGMSIALAGFITKKRKEQ